MSMQKPEQASAKRCKIVHDTHHGDEEKEVTTQAFDMVRLKKTQLS